MTTPTGIPIAHCTTCGLRHPATRRHCTRCTRPSLFIGGPSQLCLTCKPSDGEDTKR